MPEALPTRLKQAEERLRVLGIEPKAIHVKGGMRGNPYAKQTDRGRQYIWVGSWTPDELRAIADHVEFNRES